MKPINQHQKKYFFNSKHQLTNKGLLDIIAVHNLIFDKGGRKLSLQIQNVSLPSYMNAESFLKYLQFLPGDPHLIGAHLKVCL